MMNEEGSDKERTKKWYARTYHSLSSRRLLTLGVSTPHVHEQMSWHRQWWRRKVFGRVCTCSIWEGVVRWQERNREGTHKKWPASKRDDTAMKLALYVTRPRLIRRTGLRDGDTWAAWHSPGIWRIYGRMSAYECAWLNEWEQRLSREGREGTEEKLTRITPRLQQSCTVELRKIEVGTRICGFVYNARRWQDPKEDQKRTNLKPLSM